MSFWENTEWPLDVSPTATATNTLALVSGRVSGKPKNDLPEWCFQFPRQHQASRKTTRFVEDQFEKLLPRFVGNTEIKDIYKDYHCNYDLVGEIYKGDVPNKDQVDSLFFFYQKYLHSFKGLQNDVAIAAMFLFTVTMANSLCEELSERDYKTILNQSSLKSIARHFWSLIPEEAKASNEMDDFVHDLMRANVQIVF